MAFVSVTRLRARHFGFMPRLTLHTWRSARQIKRAPGFIGGYLALSPKLTMWTVTVWTDGSAMQAFRNSAWHLKAMPALIGACDEGAVANWESDDPAPPDPRLAAERMRQGRPSKVRHPSAAHSAGITWPDGELPRKGPTLVPDLLSGAWIASCAPVGACGRSDGSSKKRVRLPP